jgi:hypothetical protein
MRTKEPCPCLLLVAWLLWPLGFYLGVWDPDLLVCFQAPASLPIGCKIFSGQLFHLPLDSLSFALNSLKGL